MNIKNGFKAVGLVLGLFIIMSLNLNFFIESLHGYNSLISKIFLIFEIVLIFIFIFISASKEPNKN